MLIFCKHFLSVKRFRLGAINGHRPAAGKENCGKP